MSTAKAELRKSQRINGKVPITWHVKDQEMHGQGIIRNISTSGMMLEAKTENPLPGNCVLAFEAPSQDAQDFIPSLGRMVWSKRNGTGFAWGVEFIEPAQEVVANLTQAVQEKIQKIENAQKAKNIIGGILSVAMIALIGFSLIQQSINQKNIELSNRLLLTSSSQQTSLYNTVRENYRVLQDQYQQREAELSAVAQELDQTRAFLADAQQALVTMQGENASLTSRIKTMQAENDALMVQLNEAKEKIRLYSGNVGNLEESKSAMKLIRQGLRSVKASLKGIKQRAHLAKVEAQRERDKIILAAGNSGYLVRGGKLFAPPKAAAPAAAQKKIKIDVSLVE